MADPQPGAYRRCWEVRGPPRPAASPHGSRSACRGIDRETAQALVDGAHQVCTYSRATRGIVGLTITLM